jgi:hypothetical protein
MGRYYLKTTAVLIGLYLLLNHASAAGTLFTKGASGVNTIDKGLQGR